MNPHWEEVAAQLDELARESTDAEALIEGLASAILPVHARDVAHLTWAEALASGVASSTAAPAGKAVPASMEERLRAAELRFRTLVEQIPAVTFMAVLGEGKNEVYVSPHIEQLLGYSQETWLADPFLWYTRLYPADRELWNNEFARGCRTGGPFRAECRFMARDGHLVWVHGEARIVKDERGRPMFLQGVAFDITEGKRAQEVLLTEAVRSARVAEELEIARRVQTSILPRDFDVPGLTIAATMIPATEIGGDYYDVIPAKDGAWLAVGDVSGHGLNAGLVMLMVQSATLAVITAAPDAVPSHVLGLVNQVLYDNIHARLRKDDFVTFSLLRYTSDGRLVVAGAHEDMLIYRAATRKVEAFRSPGTWLGARRDVTRSTVDSTLHLAEGDTIVLYTDGVTEAMNSRRELYDISRLGALVEAAGAEPVERLRDRIVTAVRLWMAQQDDDISIVVARQGPITSASRSPASSGATPASLA